MATPSWRDAITAINLTSNAHSLLRGSVPITDGMPQHDDPRRFLGALYAPQKSLLYVMVDVERRPYIPNHDTMLMINQGLVQEKPSFGKTVLCIALICANPPELIAKFASATTVAPRHRGAASLMTPMMTDLPCDRMRQAVGRAGGHPRFEGHLTVAHGETTVLLDRVLPITLVLAAASVISQWQTSLDEFAPHLRVFVIDNVHAVRRFHDNHLLVRNIDVVLLKVGLTTCRYLLPGEVRAKIRADDDTAFGTRPLTEVWQKMIENCAVARLIIDDYDIVPFTIRDRRPAALFTWNVSATRKSGRGVPRWTPVTSRTPEEFVRNVYLAQPIMGAPFDMPLNTILRLSCDPAFVDRHFQSFTIRWRRAVIQGDRRVREAMNLNIPDDVRDMLAGGAVHAAARRLGIDADTVEELAERLLAGRVDTFRVLDRLASRMSVVMPLVDQRTPPSDAALALEPPAHALSDSRLNIKLVHAIRTFNDLEFKSQVVVLVATRDLPPPIPPVLRRVRRLAERDRTDVGKELERARANIREDICQGGCATPLAEVDEGAYILGGCCQLVVCSQCITTGRRGGNRHFISKCPNCMRRLDVKRITHVKDIVTLRAALQELAAPVAPVAPAPAPAPAPVVPEPMQAMIGRIAALHDAKHRALLATMLGVAVPQTKVGAPARPFIDNLLTGTAHGDPPPARDQKMIVGTIYSESTRVVSKLLADFAIPFRVLGGTSVQKARIIDEFRRGVFRILIVTATKDCGGMHMPFVSHVVFYHRVKDPTIMYQLAGRAQRLGRTHELTVTEISFTYE